MKYFVLIFVLIVSACAGECVGGKCQSQVSPSFMFEHTGYMSEVSFGIE